MFHFFALTKQKFLYFILIALGWNAVQWWLAKNSYIFYQANINNGNVPSYIGLSLDILEKCFGRAAIYPPGQSWFLFAYGWVYVFLILFWSMVWYTAASLIVFFKKADR